MEYNRKNNKYYPINSIKDRIDIVFYHMNCADGTLSCALWLYNNMYRSIETHIYPIQPSFDIISFFSENKIKRYIRNKTVNYIFLDVVPIRIKDFIDRYQYITIIDHHIGNKEIIDTIEITNHITIDFKPDSTYGAAKQVIHLIKDRLSQNQVDFSMKIAAMDMWNTDEYTDVNYINYGIKYYCFKKDIKMLSPDDFIKFSYDGMKSIEFFVKIGKQWYTKAEEYILKKFNKIDLTNLIVYQIYRICIVDLDRIFTSGPYMKQKSIMTNLICFMLENAPQLKNRIFGKNINTLAFINGSGVSLRSISSNKDLDMDYLAKRICKGGGHKPAAGCGLKHFIEYIQST